MTPSSIDDSPLSVTTTGYGNIPVLTNAERLFAIFAMITGAVACDAGIAALLSSVISDIDEQTLENSRRLKCSKKYMSSIGVEKDLYDRVLSYYSYIDDDLNNISEIRILSDFSPSLRLEILKHFCFQSMRILSFFSNLSDGALLSIAQYMKPYIAVPGEMLSEIGSDSPYIYVLQRGMVRCKDSAGIESFLALGSVIGHAVTRSELDMNSVRRKSLRIELVSAYGFTSRHQTPYLLFTIGSMKYRSSILKTHDWREICILKLPTAYEKKLYIEVKSWQSGPNHTVIGIGHINLNDETACIKQDVVVYDMQGKRTGMVLRMRYSYEDIFNCDDGVGHESSTMSIGFSHLYQLEMQKVEEVKKFLAAGSKESIIDRLDERYYNIVKYKQDANVHVIEAVPPTQEAFTNSWLPISAAQQPDVNHDDESSKPIRSLLDRAKRFSQTFPMISDAGYYSTNRKSTNNFMTTNSSSTSFINQGTYDFSDKSEKIHEEDYWNNLLRSSPTDDTNAEELKLKYHFLVEWE